MTKYITQTVLISKLAISAKILIGNEVCKVGPLLSIVDSRGNVFLVGQDKYNRRIDFEVDFIRCIIHDDII